jgi:hypothetical protein
MKTQADRHRSAAPEYVIGDKVWLSTDNLRLTRASHKLTEKWLGPYEITKLIGDNAVELRLPKLMRIHPVVNISRVRPYKEHLKGQSTFRPGPVQVTEDRELEYEVDHIVDSRLKGNRLEYLVHWKGYSDEDRTWEPLGHLSSAQDTIKDFHKVNPSAPRKIHMIQSDFLSLFTDYGKSCVETPLAKLPFDHLEVDL